MNGAIATETAGAVSGGLRTLLRLEGLTLFAGKTLFYATWADRGGYTPSCFWRPI